MTRFSIPKFHSPIAVIAFSIACMPFLSSAQVSAPKKINDEMSVELEAVQTPANTFVAAIMTTKTGHYTDNVSKVFRSEDMGQTWDSVFAVLADTSFVRNPDPVLCVDSAGIIYLIMMRIPKVPSKGQLWCYTSADDGKTWSLAGHPYQGSMLPDYPQIIAKGKGEIYLTFLEYPSYIKFVKSVDGGKTWTTGINLNNSSQAADPVGADIGWTKGGNICVAYGTYTKENLYISKSSDFGKTWSPSIVQPGISKLAVNKMVSSKEFAHLGVLSHRPHNSQTTLHYSRSEDGGNTWFTEVLDSNTALAEGTIDHTGNIHIVYNKNVANTFSLMYVYSTDKGQTFSTPSVLYSAAMNIGTAYGEYQSLLLASDGLFHATFVDYSDKFKAKQIIFSPMLNGIKQAGDINNAPLVFPNPTNKVIHINMVDVPAKTSYTLCGLRGELIQEGNLLSANTAVDVSGIGAGTYILSVHQGNRVFVTKILIP